MKYITICEGVNNTSIVKAPPKKKFKCPYCELRFERPKLPIHIQNAHEELIPEGFTSLRVAFNTINHKSEGRCIICKGLTDWNENKGRYERLCNQQICHDKYREMAAERNRVKYGTERLQTDPKYAEFVQRKALAGRKIAGVYKFADGGEIQYLGTYEKKVLEFMDQVMHCKSEDITAPGPSIEYEFQGAKHLYIPDFFYEPYELIIEIKDGGSNPNTHPKRIEEEARNKAKEEAVTKLNRFNYVRVVNNDFGQLLSIMAVLKYQMVYHKYYYPDAVIRVHENVLDESKDESHLDKDFKKKTGIKYRIVDTNSQEGISIYDKKWPGGSDFEKSKNAVIGLAVNNDKEILGRIRVKYTSKNKNIIGGFRVYDKYKGYGIGEKLFEYAVNKLNGNYLGVLSDNEIAINLYKKYGFEKVGEKKYADGDTVIEMALKTSTNESTEERYKLIDDTPILTLTEDVTFPEYVSESIDEDENAIVPVYVCLMHSGTLLANAIKSVTGTPYSHSSISFDSSLEHMYSFGRKYDNNPFIGCFKQENIHGSFFRGKHIPYALYMVLCTVKERNMMKDRLDYFIRNASKFKYDVKGLFLNYIGIEDDPEYRWFCSRFVADILNAGRPNDPYVKHPSLWRPSDFVKMNKIIYVSGGDLDYYSKYKTDKITQNIISRANAQVQASNISKPVIDTIVTDFGGVLIKTSDTVEAEAWEWAAKHGLTNEQMKTELIMKYYEACQYNEQYTTEQAKALFKKIVKPEYAQYVDDIFRLMSAGKVLCNYTIKLLDSLKKKGYKLYYLSNVHKAAYEERVANGLMDFVPKYFDGGLYSFERPYGKPDVRLYKDLINKYNLDPKRCMFIDDKKENVKTAESLGFTGMLFNRTSPKLDVLKLMSMDSV